MTDGYDKDAAFDTLLARFLEQRLTRQPSECPDPEVLAAYYERSLARAERHRHTVHFSTCDLCQQRLAALARTSSLVAEQERRWFLIPNWLRDWHRWRVLIALAAPAVLALAIGLRFAANPSLKLRGEPSPESAKQVARPGPAPSLAFSSAGPAGAPAAAKEFDSPKAAWLSGPEGNPGSALAALEGARRQALGTAEGKLEDSSLGSLALSARSAPQEWARRGTDSYVMMLGREALSLDGRLLEYSASRVAFTSSNMVAHPTPAEGPSVKLLSLKVNPAVIKPGDRVTLDLDYAVILPADIASAPIEETFLLEREGSTLTLGRAETKVREAGAWTIHAAFLGPATLNPGSYALKSRLRAGDHEEQGEARIELLAPGSEPAQPPAAG